MLRELRLFASYTNVPKLLNSNHPERGSAEMVRHEVTWPERSGVDG